MHQLMKIEENEKEIKFLFDCARLSLYLQKRGKIYAAIEIAGKNRRAVKRISSDIIEQFE